MNVTLYDNSFALLQFNALGSSIHGHHSYTWTGSGSQDNIKVYFTSGVNTPGSGAAIPHYFKIDNFVVHHVNASANVVTAYMPEILETHDYYAFGMEMPGRSVGQDYDFGFNGKMDDKGDRWQIQDYGFRSYDYRLGRFLSTDAKTASFAYLTPYQFASNRPIDGVDLDGKEWKVSNKTILGKNNKPIKQIYTLTVKVGFHNLEELPSNFMDMAEIYVEGLYQAQFTTSDGTEIVVETVADFYEIGPSQDVPISIGLGEMNLDVPVAMGQTMDKNRGENPTS